MVQTDSGKQFLSLLENPADTPRTMGRRKSFMLVSRKDRFEKILRMKIDNQTPALESELDRILK